MLLEPHIGRIEEVVISETRTDGLSLVSDVELFSHVSPDWVNTEAVLITHGKRALIFDMSKIPTTLLQEERKTGGEMNKITVLML